MSISQIQELAVRFSLEANDDDTIVFAGAPKMQPAPGGIALIGSLSSLAVIGAVTGLTKIKSAVAFVAPTFKTRSSFVRNNAGVEHFAEVEQTAAEDAVHDCYYPGEGDHIRPNLVTKDGRTQYQHYYRVSATVSDIIKKGEEEHLADAQRAFDITYKLIADTINSMTGIKFGPARSPAEADALAEKELAKRLPPELGTHPLTWFDTLEKLLKKTEDRDRRGWHSISTDPPKTERDRIIHNITIDGSNIGRVSSAEIVNY